MKKLFISTQAEIDKALAQKQHNYSIDWQYIACFPNLRESLVLVNSRVQGSDYDEDDEDDDGRWGVGKGVWFKSGHGLCPRLTLILLQAELCGVGLVSFSLFLCETSTLYNDGPAGWTTGQCRGRTHRGSIWFTLNLLELHIILGRKSLPLHHINAAWLYSS